MLINPEWLGIGDAEIFGDFGGGKQRDIERQLLASGGREDVHDLSAFWAARRTLPSRRRTTVTVWTLRGGYSRPVAIASFTFGNTGPLGTQARTLERNPDFDTFCSEVSPGLFRSEATLQPQTSKYW